ncbi:MAG: hypothetical protein FWC68_06235 [Oscillospiraceae bacterium]|nr:hypothetical protein [Oscillospiraceae bacterium]
MLKISDLVQEERRLHDIHVEECNCYNKMLVHHFATSLFSLNPLFLASASLRH